MIKASDLIAKFKQALSEGWGYIWGTAGEKWTEAKQAALEKTTDSDRSQGRLYGKRWIGHYVADCSGLFAWAFRKLGGEMYHGSDTMYRKWCTDHGELKKGKRTDGKALKPGTAVFVFNGTKYSHVGLFVGGDTVIEAMSTLRGVTTTKITATKWTNWGELKGVDFDEAGEPSTPDTSLPTLRRGSKGSYVTLAQTYLMQRGYSLGPCGIDGDFGSATEKAVKQFQKDWGITQDGVIGPQTWGLLTTVPVNSGTYTVTISGLSQEQAETLCNNYPGKSNMKKE